MRTQQRACAAVLIAALLPNVCGAAETDGVMLARAVEQNFRAWSQSWWTDRYVAGSAHPNSVTFQQGAYVFRGTFQFDRGGARFEIPFAASARRSEQGFALENLCYNDTTTNMTDCKMGGGSGLSSQQLLGAIVAIGLAGALLSSMSGGSSSSQSRGSESDGLTSLRLQEKQREDQRQQDAYVARQQAEMDRNARDMYSGGPSLDNGHP